MKDYNQLSTLFLLSIHNLRVSNKQLKQHLLLKSQTRKYQGHIMQFPLPTPQKHCLGGFLARGSVIDTRQGIGTIQKERL